MKETTKTVNEKRNAVLLMTGHTLTLLINNEPVAGCTATKRSVANLKKYITVRKGTLNFTEDNMKTFPWLRELV